MLSPQIKNKIEDIVNVFESGSTNGNYATLVKYKDYSDPSTGTNIVQITYGKSQTTEFGNLKGLLKMYVDANGQYVQKLVPYLNRLGKKPSLCADKNFCDTLVAAGRNDPLMRTSTISPFFERGSSK